MAFTLTQDNIGKHANLTYQVTPWMMMGANYVQLDTIGSSVDAAFRFDAAVKLRDAQGYVPAVHFGMRDFTHQANLQSPFAVASWAHQQWQFEIGADTHVYGNIQYTHPQYPVTLQASYHDQGRLLVDKLGYGDERPARFMLSSRWEFQPGVEVGLSVGDNDYWGLSLQVAIDSQRTPVRYEAPQTQIQTQSADTDTSDTRAIAQVLTHLELRSHGIVHEAKDRTETSPTQNQPATRLLLGVSQNAYPYWPDAIDQTHAVLTDILPDEIGSVDYVIHTDTLPMLRVHKDITRDDLFKDFSDTQRIHALTSEDLMQLDRHWLSSLPLWRVSIEHQGWLGQSNAPMSHILQASAAVQWQFDVNASLLGQINVDIAQDLIDMDTLSVNDIDPRFARLQARDLHIPQLALQYHDTAVLTQLGYQANLHYQITGGYLADNWAGVEVDMLYQPWNTRLAYGLSVAQLSARDINGLLSLRDEQDVVTHGMVEREVLSALGSVFWATPFYDIDVALHAGRFVGQDTGAKFELRRTFDNGWQFGIWASRTRTRTGQSDHPYDAQSQSQHGLYLSIPLDTALAKTRAYTRHVDFNSHINHIENTRASMLPYAASHKWWSQRAAFKSFTTQRESPRQRQLNAKAGADEENVWLLVVGGYEVTGQVRFITPTGDENNATGGTQNNEGAYYQFDSQNGDRIRFTQDGIMSIEQLAQRPLNMQFNDVFASQLPDEASVLRQVKVGQLNYAAYRCSALTRSGFSASQRCESQPLHRVELQYDKDFTPVRIAQWLVYMNQYLELKRLN